MHRLALANRLVGGLQAERSRWSRELDDLRDNAVNVVGNSALGAAFVTYAGPFASEYRNQLWQRCWRADLVDREIEFAASSTPLSVLASDAEVAQWIAEGLPSDDCSLENGCVVTHAHGRWPMLVDPQLQVCVCVQASLYHPPHLRHLDLSDSTFALFSHTFVDLDTAYRSVFSLRTSEP